MRSGRFDRIRIALALVSVVAVAAPAAAATPAPQGTPAAPSARERMAALEFLVGEWEGDGWSQMGQGPREAVHVREQVEWKVDGEVLLLQGRGTQHDEKTGAERVGHDALAVIAWDPATQRHVMWTYRATAAPTIPEITVSEGTVVWGFDVPRGKVRFTMSLDEQGRWVESGEYSADGTKWNQFMGMTLTRKSPAPAK